MKTRSRAGSQAGWGLVECSFYLALLAIILSLAIMAHYRASLNTNHLQRDAADILRAVRAGEQWREDLRTASALPQSTREDVGELLRLPRKEGDISYRFHEHTVWRRALPNTNWIPVLTATATSVMQPDPRRQVAAWRWDVELQGRPRTTGLRPLFSFLAVPQPTPAR